MPISSGGGGASGGGGWDTTLIKAADESLASSTTLHADAELHFVPVTGGVYFYQLLCAYGSPAGTGQDLKVFMGDGGGEGVWVIEAFNAAGTAINSVFQQGSATAAGSATTKRLAFIQGWFASAAGATFNFQWAQNTSTINAITVFRNSILRYTRTA